MVSPMFLLLLLVLGHTEAITITFQAAVTPNKPFNTTIDPGFEVKEAHLDKTKLSECVDSSKECYKQTVTHKVNFVILDVGQAKKVDFMVNKAVKKSYNILKDGQTSGDNIGTVGTKIAQENFPLTFKPTSMQYQKSTGTETPVNEAPDKTCKNDAAADCLSYVGGTYPVFVKGEMASDPRVLTLDGTNGEKLEATFVAYTGGAWMARSSVIIFGSLALQYFFN